MFPLSDPPRFCMVCDEHLRDNQKHFCSSGCWGLYKLDVERGKRQRLNDFPIPGVKFSCQWCGKKFVAKHKTHYFCSADCHESRYPKPKMTKLFAKATLLTTKLTRRY